MNLNRIHTIVGSGCLSNVDLSQIVSVTFVEGETKSGLFNLTASKYYQIHIVLKNRIEMWIKLKDHKTAQQEYASLFTAWTEYLEWHK